MVSVDHQGKLYDCDFNQMLVLAIDGAGPAVATIFDFDFGARMHRQVRFGRHCLGCSAGAASSCGGATA